MGECDIEKLYDDHAQALFSYLINLTRSEADTRDVLQDVFCKVVSNPKLLDNVRERRGFLIRLAHNAAIDLMRRRMAREGKHERFGLEIQTQFEPAENQDEEAFRAELSKALSELPEEQRVVVHLKLWERMTFEAIAETLQIPLNTAASRYRYGIDKLRERLRPLYRECL